MPRFVPIEELFKGWRFNQEIVVLCVRWYLSFKLSYRDWVARLSLTGQRHDSRDPSEVQHYTPEFEKQGSDSLAPSADLGGWRRPISGSRAFSGGGELG